MLTFPIYMSVTLLDIDSYLKKTFVSYDVTNVTKSITSVILYAYFFVSYTKFNFQAMAT